MMNDKTIKYLMLTQIKGVGPISANKLIKSLNGIDSCFDVSDENLLDNNPINIPSSILKAFVQQRHDEVIKRKAAEIYEKCLKYGIDIVTYEDSIYPDRFRFLSDVPVVLYIKGRLRINEYAQSVGIIGARRCSIEGKSKAIEVADNICQTGAALISGLAKGIDSYVHTSAIKNNNYTIAVLGNSPDICYPKEHQKLYEAIEEKGCLLSEYPPESIPQNYRFPERNRIIAALSDVLYVVDVGRNSGTKTTIEAGEKYGRKIISV